MISQDFAGKRVLFLQGPVGPFFWNLAKDLRHHGADVFKFNFNAGDWLFFPRSAQAFKGKFSEWPAVLEAFIAQQRIDVILLFGDCRPIHTCVRGIAQELGCALGVFEEGYLRPNHVTFEPVGVNGNSEFSQSLGPWLVEKALIDEHQEQDHQEQDHYLRNLCINPQRMCLHMRAGCGSIPAYAAIRSRPESLHQEDSQACIS